MKIIFATNNDHKLKEIQSAIGKDFEIISLKMAGIDIEIPEPHDTLKENASEKSKTIFQLTSETCFSDDTGLEVDILNGEPGVKSARYAGEGKKFSDNITKLLTNMKGKANRNARFRTVISLIIHGKEFFFEGECPGIILEYQRGENGFGYDPVFVPEGSSQTFAEMSLEEKNWFSHRRKAVDQLVSFLHQR